MSPEDFLAAGEAANDRARDEAHDRAIQIAAHMLATGHSQLGIAEGLLAAAYRLAGAAVSQSYVAAWLEQAAQRVRAEIADGKE